MIQGPILKYIFTIGEDDLKQYPPLEESDAFKKLKKLFPPCKEFESIIEYCGSNTKTFMGVGQKQKPEIYKELKILFGKEHRKLSIYGLLEVDDHFFERGNEGIK